MLSKCYNVVTNEVVILLRPIGPVTVISKQSFFCFEAQAKLAQQWLLCVPWRKHLDKSKSY